MNVESDRDCGRVYIVTFGETISAREWEEYIDFCRARLKENQPFALLHDHRKGGAPNAVQRRKLQEMLDQEAKTGSLVRASAVVSSSALVRGALTALTWLRPLPYPVKVFSAVDEARAWCAAAMERSRVE